jgi:hypothetical protein
MKLKRTIQGEGYTHRLSKTKRHGAEPSGSESVWAS